MDASALEGKNDSGLHVFFRNVRKAIGGFFGRHKFLFITLLLLAIAGTFILRETWQPWAVGVRRYVVPILVAFGIVVFFWIWSRSKHWFKRILYMGTAFALVAGCVMIYDYVALWWRYEQLKIEIISDLPNTGHERIQSLNSVHSLAWASILDTRFPMEPAFVEDKSVKGQDTFRWTMAVEPTYWNRWFAPIEEVFSVSATEASPKFEGANKVPVRFAVGEGLRLSSNAHTAAVRTFDPLRFWNYEATDVRFLRDDSGEMVEIISLLRWEGFLLPYPEFGGVLVIHQQKEVSLEAWLRRVFLGEGEWIRPERIKEFPYLRGQNLLPYRAASYIADSFRFRKNIFGPAPWNHNGDVRVPILNDDVNQQPYATYFEETPETPGMIYHYFALEPYGKERGGLVASVLIPADGTPKVFVRDHETSGKSLKGVSRVPTYVRNSNLQINWSFSVPVEHRPYVRVIDGVKRYFWLSTIVTFEDKDGAAKTKELVDKVKKSTDILDAQPEKKKFLAGAVPAITLTDMESGEVKWVNPKAQEEWVKLFSKKQ